MLTYSLQICSVMICLATPLHAILHPVPLVLRRRKSLSRIAHRPVHRRESRSGSKWASVGTARAWLFCADGRTDSRRDPRLRLMQAPFQGTRLSRLTRCGIVVEQRLDRRTRSCILTSEGWRTRRCWPWGSSLSYVRLNGFDMILRAQTIAGKRLSILGNDSEKLTAWISYTEAT
jgi:hypothetical protein